MSVTGVSRQVRALLAESGDASTILADVLLTVDAFVLECSSSAEQDALLRSLDDELQEIHHDLVDHSSLGQTEIFLTVLHHLRPVLSSISIVSTWFDLVLRPALREPKLATLAVNYAKELIICALENSRNQDKVGEFRRRLLDLYLLDALNESSGDDVLEWAGLNQEQRDRRTHWKLNLEDLLVKYGLERPDDLMTEMNICFSTPSSRLQLFMLVNVYTSQESFSSSAGVLAAHPLMDSLLRSLLLDNSSTLCTTGLTILVKLLPIFAVHACESLRRLLVQLLAVLVRIICWKERPLSASTSSALQQDEMPPGAEADLDHELEDDRPLHVRPELAWERLEMTFNATASIAPSPRALFTSLYYLFPRNTLRFLREPTNYLAECGVETPYTVSWEDALDEVKIRSKSESLTRGHILHPLIIWRDTSTEISQPDFWASYDVSRITSESTMLDLRNAAFGMRERHPELLQHTYTADITHPIFESEGDISFFASPPPLDQEDLFAADPTPHQPSVGLDNVPGRTRISLQDMISTSVALKSNLDVEILKSSASWPSRLFPTATSSPSKASISLPPESEPSTFLQPENFGHDPNQPMASHVIQAVSGLQREVLLLRNELNFELWLSRENVRHIGRLYQDRILSKNAEAERQGLYNKLRKYKAQVLALERELKEHKQQASSAKNKYADWNTELQSKLREFREEKRSWVTEATTLRNAEKEAQALFTAQGKLLAEANTQLFELQTQKKETQHKIDRLRDYERQIEQHVKMQRLWDDDFQKFNARAEEMELMRSQYRKMEMRLESYEKTNEQMDDSARGYRRQIQALEARLAMANRKNEAARQTPAEEIATFVAEKASLFEANEQLREKNADLMDEVEEMRAMLEMLKAQVSGRRGLVSARASPIMFASGN